MRSRSSWGQRVSETWRIRSGASKGHCWRPGLEDGNMRRLTGVRWLLDREEEHIFLRRGYDYTQSTVYMCVLYAYVCVCVRDP